MHRRLALLLFALALALAALANRGALQAWAYGFHGGRAGGQAPELPPLKSLDGRPVRLADLRGRVVLLHFWTFG